MMHVDRRNCFFKHSYKLCTHKIGYKLWMEDHLVVSHVLDGLWTFALSKARSLSLHLNPSETQFTPFKPHVRLIYGQGLLYSFVPVEKCKHVPKFWSRLKNLVSWTLSSQHPENITGPLNRCKESLPSLLGAFLQTATSFFARLVVRPAGAEKKKERSWELRQLYCMSSSWILLIACVLFWLLCAL